MIGPAIVIITCIMMMGGELIGYMENIKPNEACQIDRDKYFFDDPEEKIFLDTDDVEMYNNRIYVHDGNNIWIETDDLHTNNQGLFVLVRGMFDIDSEGESVLKYVKKWKCPYCFNLWPIGEPCQNPKCPSKYKQKE